jgi:putative ABC transport system permease protein
VRIYRNDRMPSGRTSGLSVRVTNPALLATLDGTLVDGRFLDAALARYPAVVLGHYAATSLGIRDVTGHPQVYFGHRWYTVVGIMAPVELALVLAAAIGAGLAAAILIGGLAGVYPALRAARLSPAAALRTA